nr:retrovirus-related Pol polyprotein from transposon TNT 1-94 [Tanacetum cinerariifolium]
MESKKVIQALKDPSWIEARQEELLQFKLQEVWTLVDLPYGKRAIGSKWVFRNKLDERGTVIRNKARLMAQRHTQEEGIDYDEVFLPVARIKAIRLFLAYASFKDFVVYQMDVKSAFLYEKIEEEVNLDNDSGKILMYPRFIQTFLDKQLDELPTYKETYDVSFHTKKVFANMKRIDKGFSGKETPLFPTMVSAAVTTITIDDITLVKALEALKTSKPKIRGIVIKDHEEQRERARQEEEANIALIETCEDIQAKVDADYQLAERMQEKEQQELNEEEKAKLFMELSEKRRKFFADKRTKDKRNRPPTKAQQRSLMYCSRLGAQKVAKESQNIGKEAKGKNSRDEALQDCVILDVSAVGPSTSTAGDIFKDEMTTIGDTLMDIRSTRPRITLVVIYNVEKEPMRATPLPTV